MPCSHRQSLSIFLAGSLLLLPLGCAYQLVDPAIGGGQLLSVPTTVNESRWRGIEASATQALRTQLEQQLDIELTASTSYKYLLKSKVLDLRRSTGVQNLQGGTTLGIGRLTLEWSLENAIGEVIHKGRISRDLEFLTSTEESTYSAATEILQDMAEQVVMELGAGLAADTTTR